MPAFKRILLKLSGEALMGSLEYGTDHHGHLDAAGAHARHLLGDGADPCGIGAVVELSHQRLAGELEEDPPESRLAWAVAGHASSPTAKRAKRRTTTFSPVFAETSARRSSMVLPS